MYPKIVCVVPTVRPECHARFVEAWRPLFEKHAVTLITVWDGESPSNTIEWFGDVGDGPRGHPWTRTCGPFEHHAHRDLFCRHSDVVRNLGFVAAAALKPDFVLTLDDDCYPTKYDDVWEAYRKTVPEIMKSGYEWEYGPHDPIAAHLGVLSETAPLSWMSTANHSFAYPRGVPYGIRDEAPVMLSHGVWVGTPDFDGETQLDMEGLYGVPKSLPYYVGPIPKGVLFPLCGMNVMVRRDALPYLYFAPMGPDTGVTEKRLINVSGKKIEKGDLVTSDQVEERDSPALHRFGDIWMGVFLKREFDRLGWACYTGASVIHHTRASDAEKNFEQEKLGREWNELIWSKTGNDHYPADLRRYEKSYADKREKYADLIRGILEGKS